MVDDRAQVMKTVDHGNLCHGRKVVQRGKIKRKTRCEVVGCRPPDIYIPPHRRGAY